MDTAQVTPEQLDAAQRLGAIGGGLSGATLGGIAGNYLGGSLADTLDIDESTAKTIGSGLGALLGGGLGGYAGYQAPRLTMSSAAQQQPAGLGLSQPEYDYSGYSDMDFNNYGDLSSLMGYRY
jgi:hypothetical protein